nr:MAG TPA: Lower collar protein [Caudoviricetes sp.]
MYAIKDSMADYTLTLGNLIARGYDTDEKLHLSAAYYPIFDESYRAKLNEKIVAHYALREIGSETPQMFVFYLGRTMREQMDYYNQLYVSAQHRFDPFITSDIRQTMDSASTNESSGKSSGTQSNESTANSTSDTKADNSSMTFNSEFPQTRIDDFRRYATSASQTDSTGKTHTDTRQDSTATATSTSNTDYAHSSDKGNSTSHTIGTSGSQSQLLLDWRSTMLNIDMMVIGSLDDLFMGMWGSGDAMTDTPQWCPTNLACNLGH